MKYVFGTAALSSFAAAAALSSFASLSDDVLHPPAYDWDHKGIFNAFDHAAIRRGHQVYTQVCAACHSLELVAYR